MIKQITLATGLSLALAASPQLMAAKYKVVDVANGGSISGTVNFSGKDPDPVVFKISKDNDVCGNGTREVDFVRTSGGKLKDVMVYLQKVKQGKPFPKGLEQAEILQQGCEFKPWVTLMENGAEANIVNDDPVLHNIHTYELIGKAKKTVMNISQPDKGTIKKKVKLKRGVAMKIECDAHDFMHAFAFVPKNPYFALVDDNGQFTIDNVPPGKYKVVAIHGTLGSKKGKVEVAPGGQATIDFSFQGK